jgi:mono/diheme cytochrome c family protein
MRMYSSAAVAALAMLLVLMPPQELPEGVTPEMVETGAELFAGRGICFSCHGPDGTGGPLAPDLTSGEWIHVDGSYSAFVELINAGVPQPKVHPAPMPPKGGSAITDEEVKAVAAYVWTLSQKAP